MSRLATRVSRLEEQEITATVERSVAHSERHGYPVDAEGRAQIEAYERHRRTWPPDLDVEEQIQRACRWWADQGGYSPEEVLVEAERLASQCDDRCLGR